MDERDRRARLLGLRLRCIRLQRSLVIHRLAESKKTSKLCQRQLYRERKLRGEYIRVVLNLKEKDPAIFLEYFRMTKECVDEICSTLDARKAQQTVLARLGTGKQRLQTRRSGIPVCFPAWK